ncbi:hypothetical protein DAPPUDRAFT_246940 [Daphnia pulex]|uniref:Integrator complex subunit 7 helical bundle domain-containing protein n=1 Tax=Daphnia pulex TaxID=6669 RepID=E9GRH2_DAPPU|nr:hypothetical protein DAPPUDRAFT_246940 [Daphnia pulex]|eukprot:EFX77915.1 hypothetical protein DAPPUDRAFT_246940 [Daphnia pulex]
MMECLDSVKNERPELRHWIQCCSRFSQRKISVGLEALSVRLSPLKAATSQTRVLQFQGEFGRLRVEFMSACSQLVQACRTLQTAPPSAIADAVAAATRDELQRCGRITHQLRKSVLVLRQVAEACPSWDRAPSTPTRRASRICSYKSRRP